jgi:hypothetical protein
MRQEPILECLAAVRPVERIVEWIIDCKHDGIRPGAGIG